MAIVLDEPDADRCIQALEQADEVVICAGTLAECLIVAARRNVAEEINALVEGLGFIVTPLTLGSARRVASAYERWGKGLHAAGLNFGDCFAYAVAREHNCPLLFVGQDFGRTDVASA